MQNLTSVQTRQILAANQILFDETQWSLLERWVDILLEANQKLNLISRKDTHQIWEKHVLHSLALLTRHSFAEGARVCDLGTGGGFPGIPLAIACPHAHFTLIDSTQKKIKAIQAMISELALPNVQTVAGRVEELGKQSRYYRRFSILTARAVAPLKSLEIWTRDLRASHAVLHVYKGGDLSVEIQELARNKSIRKVTHALLSLKTAPQFAQNQKQIVSLYF